MKVNKYKKHVPLKLKGDLKYYLTRRRMWYIGYIYRASKGQQFHNKFIMKFFTPHLHFNHKSSILFKYLYFTKLFNQRFILTPKISVFGNVDKFLPNYVYDDCDLNYQLVSKSFVKKLNINYVANVTEFYTTGGCVFLTTQSNLQFDETELYDATFFFKADYVGRLCNTTVGLEGPSFNFMFSADIDMYFILEVYKTLLLINLKACVFN